MSTSTRWADLAPRVLSGLAMAAAGALIVWWGGWIIALAAAGLSGLMVWECARMFNAANALRDGIVAGAAVFAAALVPWMLVLPLLFAAAFVGSGDAGRDKPLFLGVFLWIVLASFALVLLRYQAGAIWLLWLVLVVIASDVAGYFAGRILGGPKFWPRVSPKKTWSGTIAGWIGAAVIGLIFAAPTGAGAGLMIVSMLTAFAGQMGDIGQSAIKRRMGVKDSSALIPGHGGVFDRFDAMLGAAALAVLLWGMGLLPGAA